MLDREFSTQAALPFAITLIKSASVRSDFGFGSFFQGPAARLMTCLCLPLCASAQPSVTVSRLGAFLLCPPSRWGTRAKGDGLRRIGRENRKQNSFSKGRIKEKKESEE